MDPHAVPGFVTGPATERSWTSLAWLGTAAAVALVAAAAVVVGPGWWTDTGAGSLVALLLAGGGSARDPDLFESHPDPVVRFRSNDGRRVIDEVNEAFRDVLDIDAAPVIGMAMDEFIDLVADVDNAASVEALLDPTVNPNVMVAEAHDGQRDFLVRTTGRSDAGYVILTDITSERDRARDLAAQKDRLEEFASIVSHDLRNPLDVAKVRLDAAEETGEAIHFEKVAAAHDRMERIIADVLDLAKHGRVIDDVEVVPLADVVRSAWSTVDTGKATLDLSTDNPTMEADPERFQELLENLFRNAIEHGGSDVTVAVGPTQEGFYIEDDGSGIPEDKREEVFEPGFTSSQTGTGFGLAIVRRIAEAHGWAIAADESAAGGARFVVTGVTWA